MDEENTGQDTGQEVENTAVAPETEGGSNLNPAWNELLDVVPSMLHSQVTPHLQKWDRNYQEGINKVHSQYEPYKPYLENNVQPDQINYALQLMQAIEERPAEVIQALQEYAGLNKEEEAQAEQGQVDQESEVPEFFNHPQWKKYSDMVDQMAQIMVQQNQTNQQSLEDQALAKELSELHEKLGEFDEEWVLTKALNHPDDPLEKHVKAYQAFESGILEKSRKPGPKVMGAGGIAPDNQMDMKTLDDAGRRKMVAEMLSNAAQQRG